MRWVNSGGHAWTTATASCPGCPGHHDSASLQQRRLDARDKLGHEEAAPEAVIWVKEPAPCASALRTTSLFEAGADAQRSLSSALIQSRTRATLIKASS